MDPEEIRKSSILKARQFGVVVPLALPVLDPVVQMRSTGEIVSRILAMNAVAATAYGFDRMKAINWLKEESLIESISQQEEQFIRYGVGQANRFKVQIEGMWALAWSVGIVDEIGFANECDDQFVLMLPNMKKNQSSADFRRKAFARPLKEIIEVCDLAYCLHWAIRQNELAGKQLPVDLKPYVVVERRRALEWVLSEDEWDEITLDT